MKYQKSIVVDDMNHCIKCGSSHVETHHIFGGPNRKWSDKFGLIVPLCNYHHTGSGEAVHFNKDFMDELHAIGQVKFEQEYPELNFMYYFGRNYY